MLLDRRRSRFQCGPADVYCSGNQVLRGHLGSTGLPAGSEYLRCYDKPSAGGEHLLLCIDLCDWVAGTLVPLAGLEQFVGVPAGHSIIHRGVCSARSGAAEGLVTAESESSLHYLGRIGCSVGRWQHSKWCACDPRLQLSERQGYSIQACATYVHIMTGGGTVH